MAKRREQQTSGNSSLSRALSRAMWAPVLYFVAEWFYPDVVPFTFFSSFWHVEGNLRQWLACSWFVLAWGVGFNIFLDLFVRTRWIRSRSTPGELFADGIIRSTFAGIFEEVVFRWLAFLAGIVMVKFTNFLFFDWLGFGIAKWFFLNFFGPIANFTTFGYLEPYLNHPAGWQVGAGMLITNAFFRDGHKYQGLIGWVNSWFGGMYLFWVMFTFGLPVAIGIHFLYDAAIFSYAAFREYLVREKILS